jgi:2-aminoethylphosphonate dioxygenase
MEMLMNYSLSRKQHEFWQSNGYLKLTDFVKNSQQLTKWCDEVLSWPETPGKWMKYFEKNHHGENQLCRFENILDYHEGFNQLAYGKRTLQLLSFLMSEPASLFKEKINVKLPLGNGFTPHQDAPAFISFGQTYHITMMVAIDESTLANGCLQIASNYDKAQKTLPQKSDGSIIDAIVEKFEWHAIECKPGDVVLFDSYLPHYSKNNLSDKSRRALFITYNKQSEGGSKRCEYFALKRKHFPPDCERNPDKDYSLGASIYNVANPIQVNRND